MTMILLQANPVADVLARLSDMGRQIEGGLFNLAIAVVVFLLGWAVAIGAARLLRGLLRAAHFNQAVRGALGDAFTARHEPAAVASWAVYWTILMVTILVALDTVGIGIGASVGSRLGDVVPRIITSAFLFALGGLVAMLLGALTRRFFESAGWSGARLRGQIVTGALTGFAALLAVEQLGFAAQFVMALGIVAVGTVGLAVGLAFGLGCRDLARDFIVEYLRSMDQETPRRPE